MAKKDENLSPIGTCSFPNLISPRGYMDNESMYSVVLIWSGEDAKTAAFKKMKKDVEAAAIEAFGPEAPKRMEAGRLRSPIRSNMEKEDAQGNRPQGYEDDEGFFANFKSRVKPEGVLGDMSEAIDSDHYPGCRMRVHYTIYDYNVQGNAGIAFGLGGGYQLCDLTTPRLDGRKKPDQVFDVIEGFAAAGEGAEEEEKPKSPFD